MLKRIKSEKKITVFNGKRKFNENYELEKEQDFENIYGKPQLTVSLDITKFFDIFDFYITFSIILTNKVCANINDIKHKLYVEFYYKYIFYSNLKIYTIDIIKKSDLNIGNDDDKVVAGFSHYVNYFLFILDNFIKGQNAAIKEIEENQKFVCPPEFKDMYDKIKSVNQETEEISKKIVEDKTHPLYEIVKSIENWRATNYFKSSFFIKPRIKITDLFASLTEDQQKKIYENKDKLSHISVTLYGNKIINFSTIVDYFFNKNIVKEKIELQPELEIILSDDVFEMDLLVDAQVIIEFRNVDEFIELIVLFLTGIISFNRKNYIHENLKNSYKIMILFLYSSKN